MDIVVVKGALHLFGVTCSAVEQTCTIFDLECSKTALAWLLPHQVAYPSDDFFSGSDPGLKKSRPWRRTAQVPRLETL